MELPCDDDIRDKDNDQICYVMLSCSPGVGWCCTRKGRTPSSKCNLVSPDKKPAALLDDITDDLWLVPIQKFVQKRDRMAAKYKSYERTCSHVVVWWIIFGCLVLFQGEYDWQDWSEEQQLTTIVIGIVWLIVGVLIFAAVVDLFRKNNIGQRIAEQGLIDRLQPQFLLLGYQMEYHPVSKSYCGSLFKQYTYSYLRIERLCLGIWGCTPAVQPAAADATTDQNKESNSDEKPIIVEMTAASEDCVPATIPV